MTPAVDPAPDPCSVDVLQVATGLAWGGGEHHIVLLLKAFRGLAITQHLAVLHDGRLAAEARRLGVRVHLIPKRMRGDPRVVPGLVRLIRTGRMRIVHTHLLGGNLYGRLAGRIARVPVVSSLHYIDPSALAGAAPSPMDRLAFFIDRHMSRLSDRLITTSEDMRRTLRAQGIPAERMTTILNGIDVADIQARASGMDPVRQEFGMRPEHVVAAMAGRLSPVKNFDLFLRAARQVATAIPHARFMVIGDGPLRGPLEDKARELGIRDRVVFTGFRADIAPLLAASDLAVLCSNSETTPYVVSEAMALGKPVVATAVGGIPEQVRPDIDGLLCPRGDEAALAGAMIRLLGDPAARQAMGLSARLRAEQEFSLAHSASQLEVVYREMLRMAPPGKGPSAQWTPDEAGRATK